MEMDKLHFVNNPTAATERGEIIACLAAGLKFLHGETSEPAQNLGRRVLANIIVEILEISGYVIHRRKTGPVTNIVRV